jgi:hypothetical protein
MFIHPSSLVEESLIPLGLPSFLIRLYHSSLDSFPFAPLQYDQGYGRDHQTQVPAPPPRKRTDRDGPSEVSRHVIILGFDLAMTENDASGISFRCRREAVWLDQSLISLYLSRVTQLFKFLVAVGAQVESTTIIRDKTTGELLLSLLHLLISLRSDAMEMLTLFLLLSRQLERLRFCSLRSHESRFRLCRDQLCSASSSSLLS